MDTCQDITITDAGYQEIEKFLRAKHKQGKELTDAMILAWVNDAEAAWVPGYDGPYIEIPAHDSIDNTVKLYDLTEDGYKIFTVTEDD